jgi:plastocyanin
MTLMSRLATVLAALTLAPLAAWGCGETAVSDPTPVQTFKITPASNAGTARATNTVPPSPSAATPGGTPGGSAVIEIAGISSEFDNEEVEASSGTVTIEFDNRDGGVVHNIHVFEGEDDGGDSVAESELEVGPVTQTITFEAQPGTYYYQCDSHPATMNGILTVT